MHGDPDRLKTGQPVVLAIAGVFARPDALWFRLQARIPEASVLSAQLPGHLCPRLAETSVSAFATAFGEVVQNQLGGRPVLVVGDSIGGTVALALPNAGLRRIALDPPLQTARLWPLRDLCERIYASDPHRREFLEKVFGFDGESTAEIDYRPLVQGPARVLMGEFPLDPPRTWELMPSLLGDEDRRFLRDHPLIHTTLVQGIGHVIVWREDAVVSVVREELQKCVNAWNLGAPSWKDPGTSPRG